MALPITGQLTPVAKQTYATHLIAPIVPQAYLADSAHPINNTALSGKQKGALVLCQLTATGKLVYAFARGSAPTDLWDIATSGTDATPA